MKFGLDDYVLDVHDVAPHWGAWIEIRHNRGKPPHWLVAPHWGAWIEIPQSSMYAALSRSHPTGVRGLKFVGVEAHVRSGHVAPHWGAWIEISVFVPSCEPPSGRTPLGCVD